MMDEKRALLLIGADPGQVPEIEEVEDMIGDAVFEEARYFMRRAFIPKLADARIRKLHLLREAEIALLHPEIGADTPRAEVPRIDFAEAADLDTALKMYHSGEAWVKQMLSAAELPEAAATYFKYWIELHHRFAHQFCALYEAAFPESKPDASAKLSENIDFNEIRSDLKKGSNTGSALHRYYSRLKKMS